MREGNGNGEEGKERKKSDRKEQRDRREHKIWETALSSQWSVLGQPGEGRQETRNKTWQELGVRASPRGAVLKLCTLSAVFK